MIKALVVDALARASGERYSTFDVVGAGPRVVAGILEEFGVKTTLKTYEEVNNNPRLYLKSDIVLVSAMSTDYGALRKLVRTMRKKGYTGPVIVGGPISFEYSRLLKDSLADIVIIGEAEIPLEKMFSGEDVVRAVISKNFIGLEKIPSIAFKKSNKVIITSRHMHTPPQKLSKLKPWVKIDQSYPFYWILRYYVEVVRGCSNFHRPLISGIGGLNCIRCMQCYSRDLKLRLECPMGIPPGCGFCSVPYQFGWARSRSIDGIVREIKGLISHGAERIVLSAPDFLDYGRDKLVEPEPLTDPCEPPANIDMIEKLLEKIYEIKQVSEGKVKVFVENIKACLVDEEVARLLGKYLQGTMIHIGLETGEYEYNRLIGKPISPEQVISAARLLKKHGLRPYVYLMYGLPLMDRRVYEKTIMIVDKLIDAGVEKITLYKFIPLPFTAFKDMKPSLENVEDLIHKLKKKVNDHNYKQKEKLKGKIIRAYLVFSKGKYYGYPVLHGPTVFVKGLKSSGFSGCLAEVEITDIAPRFVWGRFLRILRCGPITRFF